MYWPKGSLMTIMVHVYYEHIRRNCQFNDELDCERVVLDASETSTDLTVPPGNLAERLTRDHVSQFG